MDLVEMYLHSREIQHKIQAAKVPKREPQMWINKHPDVPMHGDMLLALDSGRGLTTSVLHMYDVNRNQFIPINSAIDTEALTATQVQAMREHAILQEREQELRRRGMHPGYPYDRSYIDPRAMVQFNPPSEEDMRELIRMIAEQPMTPILTPADTVIRPIPLRAPVPDELIRDIANGPNFQLRTSVHIPAPEISTPETKESGWIEKAKNILRGMTPWHK
jgi:hypothetical protein